MKNISNIEIEKLFGNNWYDCIEKDIKELVFLLRNNGINTECSCEHKKYIQCQYIPDGEVMRLLNLLSCYFYEQGTPNNYEINIKIIVKDGHQYPTLNIDLKG